MSKALVLGPAALVFLAAGASAADLVAPGYGYAAPVYVAPAPTAYAAPRVYLVPQAYTAPPVTTGYYAPHPVPPEPIYDYAPGYGYDYTAPGYWNRSYWGGGYGFEWH
jgi:hypothetical protein